MDTVKAKQAVEHIYLELVEMREALEKLDDYAANTECKDCIFCGNECTFSRSIPAGWDIKEV